MVRNLQDLIKKFSDETVCREHLISQRWPDGNVVCQYCGHTKCYRIDGGERFKCANNKCYKRFRVTVGTIFEASNIPLSKWFIAQYIIMSHKKGISSIQLGKDIGVTQKTAWFMLHRIREQLKADNSPLLSGTVEIDETYCGGSVSNMNKKRREQNKVKPFVKAPLVAMVERDGNVLSKVMTGSTRDNIIPFINENVADTAKIMTDTSSLYFPVKDAYEHRAINHDQGQYVDGSCHTNTVEGYFGLFKRMVYGIYHQVSTKHLQAYVDEHNFRYNSRKQKDVDRFTEALGNVEGRLTYKALIERPVPEFKAEIQLASNTPYISVRKSKKGRKQKPVAIMKEGQVLATYSSAAEAAHVTGIAAEKITRVANGRRISVHGYQFKYI
ncbi:MAG: IS1595 family transposase [Bacteroidota bacterium]